MPDGLTDRFNFIWIPTIATLIIFNVTTDDSGQELSCEVLSVDGSGASTWKRKIQVTVLGKFGSSIGVPCSAVFNEVFKIIRAFLRLCFSTYRDWLKNLAPLSPPIKSQINCD